MKHHLKCLFVLTCANPIQLHSGVNNALPLKCNSRPPKYKSSSVSPTPSASHKAQEPCAKTVYEEREREAETLDISSGRVPLSPPDQLTLEGFLWELVTLMP